MRAVRKEVVSDSDMPKQNHRKRKIVQSEITENLPAVSSKRSNTAAEEVVVQADDNSTCSAVTTTAGAATFRQRVDILKCLALNGNAVRKTEALKVLFLLAMGK